jgi:signal transduction histidine kinase
MSEPTPRTILLEALLPGELAANTARLIGLRWLAGGLVLVATAFCVHVLRLPLPEWGLYATGAGILAYNALLVALMRRPAAAENGMPARVRHILLLQVALDWLSMAVFLHFTGGICSPAIPFLVIHMLLITILLPGQRPYLYVAMGIGVLAAIALLEGFGVVTHYRVMPFLPADLHRNALYVGAQLVFLSITAFSIVYLTSGIMARLREREQQNAALLDAAGAITSSLSLEEVMHQLARSAAEALSLPGAAIRLLDETGERLTMTAAYGLSQSYLDKGPVELTHSALDQEALAGKPVIIGQPATDPRIQYPQQVAEEGIRSLLAVPIVSHGRPLGVLRVYSDEPQHFTETDVAFVRAIAQQGATALDNAISHESLQRTEQTRGQFVRLVTHELRAPVGGAQSLLRTLLRGLAGELSDQQQDILGRLEKRLDALMELINDLLDLAASKTPEIQEAPRRMPLQPILEGVVARWEPQAAEKDVTLNCDLPFEALPVTGTEDGLARIFDNLVGNAVKYTPAGGRVSLRMVERPAGAVITVTDTGIGIPEEDLPCLWDEFFRAKNARRSNLPGTGLGLSIVRQLVEAYGGIIGVTSTEGQGTTFKVTLPIAGPEVGA